jgi:hypothetical protein
MVCKPVGCEMPERHGQGVGTQGANGLIGCGLYFSFDCIGCSLLLDAKDHSDLGEDGGAGNR